VIFPSLVAGKIVAFHESDFSLAGKIVAFHESDFSLAGKIVAFHESDFSLAGKIEMFLSLHPYSTHNENTEDDDGKPTLHP